MDKYSLKVIILILLMLLQNSWKFRYNFCQRKLLSDENPALRHRLINRRAKNSMYRFNIAYRKLPVWAPVNEFTKKFLSKQRARTMPDLATFHIKSSLHSKERFLKATLVELPVSVLMQVQVT